ncbi:hypothetical protein BDZ97DRAFT_1656009 [Flammula alnicola]|nr:hypothetical protein BDZ97DRAFT_1656009 [Flammula alnicola]
MQTRPQDLNKVLEEVLEGKQQVISYPGTSQYQVRSGSEATGIVSACGLAALNCARTIFRLQEESEDRFDVKDHGDSSFLRVVLSQETVEDIVSICSSWPSSDHLEVEDLLEIPVFKHHFNLVKIDYRRSDHADFLVLLQDMLALESGSNIPVAAIITRTPEIVVCLKLSISFHNIFVIFDSHPRPSHPSGSGFIVNSSLEGTAAYLHGLLAIDPKILADHTMQWQAELLSQFSGHIIVPSLPPSSLDNFDDILMEASKTILQLKVDLADSKRRESYLSTENHDLKAKVAHNEPYQGSRSDFKGKQKATHAELRSTSHFISSLSDRGRHRTVNTATSVAHSFPRNHASHNPPQSDDMSKPGIYLAMQLQNHYDEEDQRLTVEHAALGKKKQATFQCAICLEELQIDHIAQFASCKHSFCRDCLRTHVISTLNQRRYPILCPACSAGNAHEPSSVDDYMFQVLGLTDSDFEILQELQLAAHSVVLHCRKCKETMFVDRSEYQANSVIVCPLPACSHVWCKNCQQDVIIGGPQHSCDGSSELEHLMKNRGWRHCPGCQTPIQKVSGCNHMQCLSPGCNTQVFFLCTMGICSDNAFRHFCYVCGQMITQSVSRSEISSATSAHFRRCQM